MDLTQRHRESLLRAGSFTLRVMPSTDWVAIRSDQHQALPSHESVLRPLINASDEGWAYEINEESKVYEIASKRLRRVQGKFRVDLSGDPIRGHELLWNASGGQRGSIALVIPTSRVPAPEIYSNCHQAFVVGNSTVPHTPSAVRLARTKAADGKYVCCLLSRTNGLEWISVYARTNDLERMLLQAQSLVVQRSLYNDSAA